MIIKSLSRTTKPSSTKSHYRQLVEYVGRDCAAGSGVIAHNFYGEEPEAVIAQFEQNEKYLAGARGTVKVYHEILSVKHNPKVPLRRQEAILRELVSFYISLRCPGNLAYGRIHFDRENLHCHLVISPNPVAKNRRLSLRKTDFDGIKKRVEDHRIKHYPELGLERYMDDKAAEKKRLREHDQPKITDREYALKKRTDEPSRKERDHKILKIIFTDRAITSEIRLHQELQKAGFSLYQRGSLEGVQCLHRPTKYRLRTLGIERSLQSARDRIQVFTERQSDLSGPYSRSREHDRNRGRS